MPKHCFGSGAAFGERCTTIVCDCICAECCDYGVDMEPVHNESGKAIVCRVKLEPHAESDHLAIVRDGGRQVVVRRDEWKDGDLGVLVPVDSMVHSRAPEFSWLAGGEEWVRIRPRMLRGQWSEGVLVPAPPCVFEGEDVTHLLKIKRYAPPMPSGNSVGGPSVAVPVYDVESFNKFGHLITEGEDVVVTEKIHGANARYVYCDGKMHFGSRQQWKSEDSIWGKAASKQLRRMCELNPRLVVYGEVYGWVQDLRYGASPGEVKLAVFDMYDTYEHVFLPWRFVQSTCYIHGVPTVPEVMRGPWDKRILEMAGSKSLLADHPREGIVIQPWNPRCSSVAKLPCNGRVILKKVSNEYLARTSAAPADGCAEQVGE